MYLESDRAVDLGLVAIKAAKSALGNKDHRIFVENVRARGDLMVYGNQAGVTYPVCQDQCGMLACRRETQAGTLAVSTDQ